MLHKRKKVTVIGSGFVGATCAHWILSRALADVALIDINDGLAKGRALDLYESTPLALSDLKIRGGSDYQLAEGSDIVVITAGLPRRPGMSRSDLLSKNAEIMKNICENLKSVCPEAIYIVVSNPLDAMVYLAHKILRVPKERILGMAGVLDTARFKTFVSEALNVSVKDISALVLGGHGDSMVPLTRLCTVGGIPLKEWMDQETIEKIIQRTRKGGGEIVSLLKTGSAYYAPSLSVVEMIEAILLSRRQVFPCAALLAGEYGEKDIFIGVPCLLGGRGLEKILEISLEEQEKKQLKSSIQSVKETLKELKSFL